MLARAIAKHLGGTVDPDTQIHTPGVIDGLRFDESGPTGNVFLTDMPAAPDLAVLIKVSGGGQVPGRHAMAQPAVQVLVRALDLDTVEATATAVHTALDLLDHCWLDENGPDAVWLQGSTAAQSHPIDIGVDTNRRPERSLNFDLSTTNPDRITA